MHHPRDASSARDRYGLVLVEIPRSQVVAENPWRSASQTRARGAPNPRARAERFAFSGFALTYLAGIGWLGVRALRWLIAD